MLELIAGFAIDQAGRLLFNTSNVNRSRRVAVRLAAQHRKQTKGLLQWIFKSLLDLFGLNKEYFESMGESNETEENKALRILLLQYGYNVKEDKIIQGGYLSGIANSEIIAQDIARFMNQALASRMPMNEFRKRFRSLWLNPGKTGLLERHFQRFTRDLFQQFDRSVQLHMAEALGLEHFIYAGTKQDNTRPFCERRMNKVYTKGEADKWQEEKWKGKIPNVDFYIQCGGYNCRHHLNFVSQELGPVIGEKRGGVNSYNKISDKN